MHCFYLLALLAAFFMYLIHFFYFLNLVLVYTYILLSLFQDSELAAAAVLLPKFKTSWTDRADVIEAGKARYFQRFICSHFYVLLCLNTWISEFT